MKPITEKMTNPANMLVALFVQVTIMVSLQAQRGRGGGGNVIRDFFVPTIRMQYLKCKTCNACCSIRHRTLLCNIKKDNRPNSAICWQNEKTVKTELGNYTSVRVAAKTAFITDRATRHTDTTSCICGGGLNLSDKRIVYLLSVYL